VSDRVKTVAEAQTARDVEATAAPRAWYGSLYWALYTRNTVSGYRLLKQEHFADALSWLGGFHKAASSTPQADDNE